VLNLKKDSLVVEQRVVTSILSFGVGELRPKPEPQEIFLQINECVDIIPFRAGRAGESNYRMNA
jgi:hypothetical protein